MKTYTFATPLQIATGLSSSITVKSVQVTAMSYTQTPQLAQIGTGELDITLTDPVTGYQGTIRYRDASVLDLWTSAVSPVQGETFADVAATALFNKLAADGKLPAGALS